MLGQRQLCEFLDTLLQFVRKVVPKLNMSTIDNMDGPLTILTEEALQELVCAHCLNYLSHGKVQLASKMVVCGRCRHEQKIPTVNESVSRYLFPCTNRFQGCNQMLLHFQVENHERKCHASSTSYFSCPECRYKGNGTQLYNHCLKQHPKNVLKYPVFPVRLLEVTSCNYIYCHNNRFVVISFELRGDGMLNIRTTNFTCPNSSSPLKYRYVFESIKEGMVCHVTDIEECTKAQDVNANQTTIQIVVFDLLEHTKYNVLMCTFLMFDPSRDLCLVNSNVLRTTNVKSPKSPYRRDSRMSQVQDSPIKVTADDVPNDNNSIMRVVSQQCQTTLSADELSALEKSQTQLRYIMDALKANLFPKFKCCGCGCFAVRPIYRCPINHVRCETCSSSYCTACGDIQNWSVAEDLEVFQNIVPLPCRWENCSSVFLSAQLRIHEKTCRYRKYRCPVEWCSWSGTLDNLSGKHWHESFMPVYERSHNFYGFNEDYVEFFLIVDHELFYCRVDPLSIKGRLCHFRPVDNISGDSYEGRFNISHYCDGKIEQRQTVLKSGGITLVSREKFEFFGQCKNYQCLFSIVKH